MAFDFDNERPIYIQIVDLIKTEIITGKYNPGDKLPSVRELAESYRVNPNTMQRAFSDLESLNLVKAERTSGRYVTKDINLIKKLKIEIADSKVDEFLEYMNSLGIDNKETIYIIKERNN